MFSTLFIFCTFFIDISSGDPRKYYLHDFKPGKTILSDIEPGANLYISTFDDVSYLRNITLTSGNITVTAEYLSIGKNDDGTQKSLKVTRDGVVIESENSLNITMKLTGTIYTTTASQAMDSNFVVFVVKESQTIDRRNFQNSTIVLLNPYNDQSITSPLNNALIDQIVQAKTTSFIAFRNFPGNNYQDLTINSTIFRNPLKFKWSNNATIEKFFPHIESLQFPIDAFYIIANGELSFRASSTWIDRKNLTTTELTTTGLILNEKIDSFSRINFIANQNNYQTMGYVTNANVNYDLRVNMIASNTTIYQTYEKGVPVHNQVKYIDSHIDSLTVDPQSSAISDYSIQYFSIDGMSFPIESTTPLPIQTTTSTSIKTTTTEKVLTTTTRGAAQLSSCFISFFILLHFITISFIA